LPKLSIVDFVQKIKGSSSHYLNSNITESQIKFAWQRGYGVFSISEKNLNIAIKYVINQNHHNDNLTLLLETDSEENNAPKKFVTT